MLKILPKLEESRAREVKKKLLSWSDDMEVYTFVKEIIQVKKHTTFYKLYHLQNFGILHYRNILS